MIIVQCAYRYSNLITNDEQYVFECVYSRACYLHIINAYIYSYRFSKQCETSNVELQMERNSLFAFYIQMDLIIFQSTTITVFGHNWKSFVWKIKQMPIQCERICQHFHLRSLCHSSSTRFVYFFGLTEP